MKHFLMFILYVYHCTKSKIQFDVEGSALLNMYVSLYNPAQHVDHSIGYVYYIIYILYTFICE